MGSCVKSLAITKNNRRLRSVADLVKNGLLSDLVSDDFLALESMYDIGISEHIRELLSGIINPSNDPIGRQYIPSLDEMIIREDELSDPIGDDLYSPVNGIVHRYPDRVLFKVTNICEVYCRYCFRKEMIGSGSNHLSNHDFIAAIDYIRTHNEIWEVILTGGDPFIISPQKLQKILDELSNINHVQNIRVHTRIPIANPSKIDDTMLSVLKSQARGLHVVLHVNHVKEITKKVESVILQLRAANCSVYSQSVLLKGVNDDAKTLESLFKKLVSIHVKPYYLHHLDRAKGSSHFRVPLERGMEIMKELQGKVSGLCLPKYMLDIVGGHGKIPANESYIKQISSDLYNVEDYQGCEHLYIDGIDNEKEVKVRT